MAGLVWRQASSTRAIELLENVQNVFWHCLTEIIKNFPEKHIRMAIYAASISTFILWQSKFLYRHMLRTHCALMHLLLLQVLALELWTSSAVPLVFSLEEAVFMMFKNNCNILFVIPKEVFYLSTLAFFSFCHRALTWMQWWCIFTRAYAVIFTLKSYLMQCCQKPEDQSYSVMVSLVFCKKRFLWIPCIF